MKTATVRDLRNHYTRLLEWVSSGEDIVITQRGKSIARLIPDKAVIGVSVDWTGSSAVMRDRSQDPILTSEESAQILAETGGQW